MNGFFWAIWFFSGGHKNANGLPWAVWPTIGWGIGLLFHFIGAYVAPRANSVEDEYNRLKGDQSNRYNN
jgi:sterol desaturase/sphingolipid hydroxylase (fatty acid hydroxylase superfamily)